MFKMDTAITWFFHSILKKLIITLQSNPTPLEYRKRRELNKSGKSSLIPFLITQRFLLFV